MKKVFVGISGGVDSSVSAYLLKKAGYKVTGVFIRAWYPDFISCDWRKEMHDAMRICAKLEIPFIECDLEQEYKRGVIDYMIKEYEMGRTPNPDVMCNKEIKFKAFLDFAIKNGADYIATGHYAQKKELKNESFLVKAKDLDKDQTYFIWNLNQEILTKVLFPIGHLLKKEVREIAKRADLHTFCKKDSQGLCFIGHVDMKYFLKHYLKTISGNVLDETGKIIGKHEGSILYTLGERHGFEIFHKKIDDKPFYVIKKDTTKNTITVSNQRKNITGDKVKLKNVNWIRKIPAIEEEFLAKIRYRHNDIRIQICNITGSELTFKLSEKNDVITPGQSIVFYSSDGECLGGGICEELL